MLLLTIFSLALALIRGEPQPDKRCPCPVNSVSVQEPYVCPADVAAEAGVILAQNWCTALKDADLAMWQSAIYRENATTHAIYFNYCSGMCVDTGVQKYENNMVPLMYNRAQCLDITVSSSYLDSSSNRLIVYANTTSLRDNRVTYENVLFTMEAQSPGKRGCLYKIIYQQYYDTVCWNSDMAV